MDHANANADDRSREAAHLCLLDALACAFQALQQPACTKVLGPVVPGATMPFGARVPGTSLQLDPVQAAFNLGTMIGWLDQREAALATDDGHLSDTLGALLCVGDYSARKALAEGCAPLTVRDVLSALLATDARTDLQTDSARRAPTSGVEPANAMAVACATSVASLLGGSPAQIAGARELATRDLHLAVRDGVRRPPWWLGDVNARGVRLALLALAAGTAALDTPALGPPSNAPLPVIDAAAANRVRERFQGAVAVHFPPVQAAKIVAALLDRSRLESLPINELVALTVRN